MRSSVVLPEPLRPDSVRRSRRSSRNETPRRSGSPAMSLARSEAMTTAMGREARRSATAHGVHIIHRHASRAPHPRPDPRRARSQRSRRAGPRRRRGAVRRDQRQGRHERGLLGHRLLPAAHPAAQPPPVAPGQAQGRPQAGREGAPGARRPARRLVAVRGGAGVVRYERPGAAALVTIDRPERRNAIDGPTAEALHEAFRRFLDDDDARVLVLTGAGDQAFCAGADLKAIDTLGPRLGLPEGPLGFSRLTPPKPTIAAVSGWCLAGGFELALWCDLRVAAATARFGFTEGRFGAPLIDGGTQRLPRIVGTGRALDLVLSGRVVEVEEAERIGLVTEVVAPGAPVARALAMAERLAASPEDTMPPDRRAVLEGAGLPLPEGLALEATL